MITVVSDSDGDDMPPRKIARVDMVNILECDSSSDGDGEGLSRELKLRRSRTAAAHLGLAPKEFRRLKRWRIPRSFLAILAFMVCIHGVIEQDVDLSEWFAGLGHVEGQGTLVGLTTAGYEIRRDEVAEDFLTPYGFSTAIRLGLRHKQLSCTHWDTVCSSWIYMCRASTLRSRDNPLGDPTKSGSARRGNLMVFMYLFLSVYLIMYLYM